MGQGPGCAANGAAGGPLVSRLLEQSSDHKEATSRELRDKYWQEGYGSYFSYGNKRLAHNPDGTWSLEEPEGFEADIARKLKSALSKGKDSRAK